MAEVKGAVRPLSPHLQIYRLPITAITSILTRITGHALMAGVVLAVWWLLAAALGDGPFAIANAAATSWFGDLVFTLSLWAIWYHYCAGLRHLYYDAGHGLEKAESLRLSWVIIAASVVLTILTIVII